MSTPTPITHEVKPYIHTDVWSKHQWIWPQKPSHSLSEILSFIQGNLAVTCSNWSLQLAWIFPPYFALSSLLGALEFEIKLLSWHCRLEVCRESWWLIPATASRAFMHFHSTTPMMATLWWTGKSPSLRSGPCVRMSQAESAICVQETFSLCPAIGKQ